MAQKLKDDAPKLSSTSPMERGTAEDAGRGIGQDWREFANLSLLQKISHRLVAQDQVENLYEEFLTAAVFVMCSDMGSMQILDPHGSLRIVAHRGFQEPYLNFFRVVTGTTGASCGMAKSERRRIIVDDITSSSIFVGTPSLEVLLDAGVRSCQSTPLISRSGEILGVISTHYRYSHRPGEHELQFLDLLARQAADLIEHLKQKQELESYADKLGQLVKERTNQLEQALEAESRSRREAELLRDILAHDILNYNQAARINAEMLADEIKNESDRLLLAALIGSIDSSTSLVKRAAKMGKILAQGSNVVLRLVNVRTVIEDSLNIVRKSRFDKKIILEWTGESPDVDVRADDMLLEVFVNLLSNSVKYTNEEKVLLRVGVASEGDSYKITIEDHGVGIPEEQKADLFKRYLKGAHGSGLGLSIAHALIADRYLGRIMVKDRVEGDFAQGTSVMIFLQKGH
jgi:signal transduction histidine kinase